MPGFIRNKKDEARWSKAKKAAEKSKNKDEKSFSDTDWALVNHIYHQMSKSQDLNSLEQLKSFLEKARKRLSDEPFDPYEEDEGSDLEQYGFHEIDPEQEDEASRWLQENEPKQEEPKVEESEDRPESQAAITDQQELPKSESRFPQPSREDIAGMREYTRPWEQKAREKNALEAQAHVNPVLYHQGKLIESRNAHHADRQKAYEQLQLSPEYKSASTVQRMKMDRQFHKDWLEKNPNHTVNAITSHATAHKHGAAAKDIHAAAKDEQIRHILSGGAQAESPMSMEEAMQHAGGIKEDEGTTGAITQDKAASFAAGNKQFLKQYAENYASKAKKPTSMEDMTSYDDRSSADVTRILGDHPGLKNPAKKAKVDSFFQKYHPLISMSANKVLNKLGIDRASPDVDFGMLHEAGMHGLFQAINDYDHDHPSKASFATHAGNKIRGLMQTALRTQDVVPQEMRSAAKRFSREQYAAPSVKTETPKVEMPKVETPKASIATPEKPKTDAASLISKHPPEVADRFKRISVIRRTPKSSGEGQG